MILRSAFGIGLVCLAMSHLPSAATTMLCSATPACGATVSQSEVGQADAGQTQTGQAEIQAAVFQRLHAMRDEIRNDSGNKMVSDAAAMGDNLRRLLPVKAGF